MKILRNKHIPIKGFSAINLFGILVAHPEVNLSPIIIQHEMIHTAQIREMAYVGFYLWYGAEWLMKTILHRRNGYYFLSMEREAYAHQNQPGYLDTRRHYAWIKYLRKS